MSIMNIGQRIKKYRKLSGVSVDQIAEMVGKNRATIYRYESNKIEDLPISIIEPLAEIIGITPSVLMGWEDEREKITVINENQEAYTSSIRALRDLTEEERKKVLEYIEFIKSQRDR